MNAPIFHFGAFNDEISLVVAFVIGIAFGFFLEQAGFGSARKLTAQFYFKDLAVLKVMFTAIVTAMTALYTASRLGLMDLSLVHLTPTFVVPQMIGGLLLGVGFVIGGYCPGTSVVSAATGRLDAVVFLAGMGAGSFAFGELLPLMDGWTATTALGEITLPQWLGVPHGVVVLVVVVFALAAFAAAEWAERRWGGVQHGPDALTGRIRRLNPARGLAAALLGLGIFAALGGSPYREDGDKVDARELACAPDGNRGRVIPSDLATWIIEGRADFTVVDVRNLEDFSAGSIPGATHVPMAGLAAIIQPHDTKLVLVAADDAAGHQACATLRAGGARFVYVLAGGFPAWKSDVLEAGPAADSSPEARDEFARRQAVARHFLNTAADEAVGGARKDSRVTAPDPGVETTPPRPAPPKRKRREGC